MSSVKISNDLGIGPNVCLAASGFAALSLILPQTAVCQSTISVTGVVRDFYAAHPDFGVPALGTTGHWAGTVDVSLVPGKEPVLVPGGFEVAKEWTEMAGENIAPHLYSNQQALGTVLLGSPPNFDPMKVTIDSWSSTLGSYGGANVGPAPAMQWPAPMPVITAPTGLPPYPGNSGVNQNVNLAAGAYVLGTSFECNRLSITAGSIITVAPSTNLVIYCTGDVSIGQNTIIAVPPGSTLEWYFTANFNIGQGTMINMLDPMVPSRCKLYNLRNRTMMFNQQGKVCAQIFAPQGTVRLRQDDQLFGNLVADDLQIDQGGALHWDGLAGTSACGIPLLDKAGVNGATGNGQVTSSATFAEWFTDVLGENQSKLHSIDLVDNGTGIYEYLGGQFYPVDGDLLGNEGAAHNENFTFTFTASFKYEACIGQFLTVEGGDGLWVFINGALVIDLGGVDYAMDEYIDVDRLGLSDQQVYEMRVFYASRNSSGSVLNLRTNIPLIYVPSTVTITGTGD